MPTMSQSPSASPTSSSPSKTVTSSPVVVDEKLLDVNVGGNNGIGTIGTRDIKPHSGKLGRINNRAKTKTKVGGKGKKKAKATKATKGKDQKVTKL